MVYSVNGEQYTRRKLLKINTASVALTDYQIPKTISHESIMQSNLEDVRFTTLAGVNIPYWEESVTGGTDADIWMKVPSISNSVPTYLWQYYGNPNASSASSISDTFIDGSEFNDLSGWTQQSGSWSVSSGILTSSSTSNTYLRRDTTISESEYIIRFRTQVSNARVVIIANANNPLANTAGTEWMIHDTNDLIYCADDWSSFQSAAATIALDTWYLGELKIKSGDNLSSMWDDDGTFKNSVTQTLNSAGSGNYWGIMASPDVQSKFDWVFVRKYTAAEPTWAADGNEQHQRRIPSFIN